MMLWDIIFYGLVDGMLKDIGNYGTNQTTKQCCNSEHHNANTCSCGTQKSLTSHMMFSYLDCIF
jgi:hypothetical protein